MWILFINVGIVLVVWVVFVFVLFERIVKLKSKWFGRDVLECFFLKVKFIEVRYI